MKLNDTIERKEIEEVIDQPITNVVKPPKKPIINKKVKEITEDDLEKLIPQWKKEYGKIFKNEINDNGDFVIWRALKRKEYKELLNNEEEFIEMLERQEKTVEMVTLYPSDIRSLIESNAGLATVLSEKILGNSGFKISETEIL